MTEPDEFESVKGGMIPRKISVDYISFSAHVDYSQNSEFIELVKAQHVVSTLKSVSSLVSIDALSLGSGAWGAYGNGTSPSSYDLTVQGAR